MRLSLLVIALALLLAPTAAAQLAPPTVQTGGAQPSVTSATVNGTIDPDGAPARYRFEYGTSTAYGSATSEQTTAAGTEPIAVKAELNGLAPATTYHYRLVASGADGTRITGANRTFKTSERPPAAAAAPRVTRPRVGARTATTATVTALIDPNRAATTWRVEWGTTSALGRRSADQSLPAGDAAVPVTLGLDGLPPYKRIYWRIVAANSAGEHRSGIANFATQRAATGITLGATPRPVAFGSLVSVSGRVQGSGVSGVEVVLEAAEFPFSTFTEVGRVRARGRGDFRFASRPLTIATRFRATTVGATPVASRTVHVDSRALVGIARRAKTRRFLRLSGRATPNLPQGTATLQRRTRSGGWRFIRRIALADSAYDFRVFRARRAAYYRVKISANDGGAHLGTVSAMRRVAAKKPARARARRAAAG